MANLHLISHTHWDREWYLTYQQFRIKLVHLVDGLLDLFAKDPGYRYFMLDGQTILLDDYLQVRPERVDELRQLIQSGRILIGPWYVLPDEFLVSPEAIIRNLLIGDRICQRFGAKMPVGYVPDPFGHIGQLPQILQGFGMENACVARGIDDRPTEFWWQAPDGSRVFMAYLRDSYDNAARLNPAEPGRFVSDVCEISENLLAHSSAPRERGAALLMFGTDHMEPPKETSQAIAYANQRLNGDQLIHSTLPAYLEDIRSTLGPQLENLPTVQGELRACSRRHLLPGVLSSRMWIKQRNQRCQMLLEGWAEPFSTWAEMLYKQQPNPGDSRITSPIDILSQAWKLLLENHPHDSICGCSIDQVHEEMRPRFDQVEQIGEEITRQSLEAIASNIQTSLNGSQIKGNIASAIVVFNPSAGPRTDLVEVTVELPPGVEQFEIVDGQGQILPHQFLDTSSHDLIHVALDRNAIREGIGMIHVGRAMGFVIKSLQWRREGDRMLVDVILSEKGEPDPAAWEQGLVEAEKYLSDPTIDTFIVHARSAPSTRVMFTARDIPGYGYRTFWVRPVEDSQPGEPIQLHPLLQRTIPLVAHFNRIIPPIRNVSELGDKLPVLPKRLSSRLPYQIENESFSVSVDEKTGLVHLYDKRSGQTWEGLNRFVSGGDRGDEYNYCPPEQDNLIDRLWVRQVRVDKGPVQQWIEIEGVLRVPAELSNDRQSRSPRKISLPILTRLVLTQGVPRLDIKTEVNNTARDHRLRVHFPALFSVQEADYDGHYEIIRRKTGHTTYDSSWVEQPRPEQPQRAFTIISNEKYGLAIANRGLPEIEVFSAPSGHSEIALTLLRCTGWLSRDDFSTRRGNAGPSLTTPGAQMQGKHTFEYAIIPFAPDPQDPYCSAYWDACRQAWSFNAPFRGMATGLQARALPAAGSLVHVEPSEFVISAIKTAEDGAGWIVRGYNPSSHAIQVKLTPWQICKKAWKTMLSEQPLSELSIEPDGSVCLAVNPREILTIRFT